MMPDDNSGVFINLRRVGQMYESFGVFCVPNYPILIVERWQGCLTFLLTLFHVSCLVMGKKHTHV